MTRSKSTLVVLVALVVVLAAVGPAVAAPPPPPAAYYGSLTVDGEPAPAGVTVTAEIDGEVRGSLTTGDAGRYGGAGAFDPKLQVDGTDGDDGSTVQFFVEGAPAGSTTWRSGDVREVALSATDVLMPTPSPPPGQGSGGGFPPITTPTETPTPPGSADTPTITTTRSDDGVDVTVTDAQAGQEVTVKTNTSGDTRLDSIAFTPRVNGSFTLNVSLLADPPAGTPPLPDDGSPIGFVRIDHSIADADVDGVTLRFRVSKRDLADRQLDSNDVTMYRLHDGAWTPLATDVVDESASSYAFEASSPGLSVFAIGQRVDEKTTPTPGEEETPTATPETPEPDTAKPFELSGFGPVVGAVALLVTALLASRRSKR